MSSSHRSSPSRRRRPADKCPLCGGGPIAEVVENLSFAVGSRRYRFTAIPLERCRTCKERILRLETSEMLDRIILGKRKPRAA